MNRNLTSLVIALCVLAGCESSKAHAQLDYEMREETSTPTSDAELTLWETDLRYPVFRGTSFAATINADIQGIVHTVQCEGDGSRYLEVKTHLLSDRYLSLSYASAVMCESDIREQKTKGFLNYDLAEKKPLRIESKIKPAARDAFFSQVNAALTQDMHSHTPADVTCETGQWDGFYLTSEGIVFDYEEWSDYFPCYGSTLVRYDALSTFWIGELPAH